MDVAAVGAGHGANDGQAQSCPMVAAHGCAPLGGGESTEGFEQAGELVGRHRGAGVFHGELGGCSAGSNTTASWAAMVVCMLVSALISGLGCRPTAAR